MKAPQKWTISVLSTGSCECRVNDWRRWGKKWGINYPWPFCSVETNSTHSLTTHFWKHKLIALVLFFKTIIGYFFVTPRRLLHFNLKIFRSTHLDPEAHLHRKKKKRLMYAFNNCASLPLQSGLSCSLISCRSAVLEWWHFQWAGTPSRPCIQLWVPRSRKGNAEIHQDQLRYQLSVWFPSPPSACVPAPGSFKSHLIWSLWGFN